MSTFNEYARHQWRRRICILQAIDNKADSVKLPIPQGKENEKKLSFSFSEVQDLGTIDFFIPVPDVELS